MSAKEYEEIFTRIFRVKDCCCFLNCSRSCLPGGIPKTLPNCTSVFPPAPSLIIAITFQIVYGLNARFNSSPASLHVSYFNLFKKNELINTILGITRYLENDKKKTDRYQKPVSYENTGFFLLFIVYNYYYYRRYADFPIELMLNLRLTAKKFKAN